MENENLNGLNGKPKVQILLQEHSRITFDSVSVGFDNKTTRAEQLGASPAGCGDLTQQQR